MEERVPVPAGSALRARPHPLAPAVTTVDAASDLPLLERQGGWARVRYGARKGWVLLDPSAPTVDTREPGRADPDLLVQARARLGDGAHAGSLGPWILHTDLDPDDHADLLRFLDRVAGQVPALHRERYGLGGPAGEEAAPVGSEAVVLFAREAAYRAFAEEGVALRGLDEGGFAGFGLVALYAEGRDREELAALLVHELTHLRNARLLGPATPPWLEEGLANDLAYSRIGPGGVLDPSELGGREEVRGRSRSAAGSADGASGRPADVFEVTVSTQGPRAALDRVIRGLRQGGFLPLDELTALDWRSLTDPRVRGLAYAESALFVRYLLEDETRAERFRVFLRGFGDRSVGKPVEPLPEALGVSWRALQKGFERWLLIQDL